jgi:hypothetical protein
MSRKEIGKTKTQVLRSIKTYRTANMDCTDIIATSVRMLHRGAIVTRTGRRRHRLEVCSPRSCAAVTTNHRRQDDGSSHGFSGDLSNMIGEPGGVRLGAAGPSPQCWYRAGSPDQAGSLSQSNDPTDAKRYLNDEGGETSAHHHNVPGTGFLFLRRLALNRRRRMFATRSIVWS